MNKLKRGLVRLIIFVLICLAMATIDSAFGWHLGDGAYNISLLVAVGIYYASIGNVLRKLGLASTRDSSVP